MSVCFPCSSTFRIREERRLLYMRARDRERGYGLYTANACMIPYLFTQRGPFLVEYAYLSLPLSLRPTLPPFLPLLLPLLLLMYLNVAGDGRRPTTAFQKRALVASSAARISPSGANSPKGRWTRAPRRRVCEGRGGAGFHGGEGHAGVPRSRISNKVTLCDQCRGFGRLHQSHVVP